MLPLADSAKQALLKVARRAVILAVERREILQDLPDDEALQQPGNAFVTLHRMGRLRGCVGQVASKEPLVSGVAYCAMAAALDDPRYFAGSFDAASWDAWRVFLKALEALPMDAAEIAIYRHHTGHSAPPTRPARYAELVVGRRGGKDSAASGVAALRTPGPQTARQTPGRPVARA